MLLSEKESKIASVGARSILDSRGEETIETSVVLESGASGTCGVPQGKSKGTHEAVYISVADAVKNIETIVLPKLRGFGFNFQKELDEKLIKLDGTKNKSKLGANVILGVSIAAARARAKDVEMPFWEYIRENYGDSPKSTPKILANIINGGMHAKNNLDFQEYMLIPRTDNFMESLKIIRAVYEELKNRFNGESKIGDEGGFAPDFKDNAEPFEIMKEAVKKLGYESVVDFGLDAAASDVKRPTEELFGFYKKIKADFDIAYIEDPFSEEDFDDFRKLETLIGENTMIVGDDLTTTNVERMALAYEKQAINGMIVKPNQIGSLTETLEAIRRCRDYGWAVIISHRSGETMDDFIADIAWAVGAEGIKIGSPSKPERLAKYVRLLDIQNPS
ncbi:MAG: phosphopyruvate hydratase [Patescibacteria group bacterium]|nr:phosphopyruvate hydratase [Patescibacteria group bacterium]MCL5261928.1 phosphopyruvate hydratase [Patescibacteria group bacterium]